MLVEGKLPLKYLNHANKIKYYYENIYQDYATSKHHWIDKINDKTNANRFQINK